MQDGGFIFKFGTIQLFFIIIISSLSLYIIYITEKCEVDLFVFVVMFEPVWANNSDLITVSHRKKTGAISSLKRYLYTVDHVTILADKYHRCTFTRLLYTDVNLYFFHSIIWSIQV